jgi:hypothetical protein
LSHHALTLYALTLRFREYWLFPNLPTAPPPYVSPEAFRDADSMAKVLRVVR